jgi:hypothetical protein
MSRPTLQVSGNLGGRHSGEEGANAPLYQHAAPVSVAVPAYGEGQVREFVGANRHDVALLMIRLGASI